MAITLGVALQMAYTSPPWVSFWEQRCRHPSQQKINSPTACASCSMPTADESNPSTASTLHPHCSTTCFLYRYCDSWGRYEHELHLLSLYMSSSCIGSTHATRQYGPAHSNNCSSNTVVVNGTRLRSFDRTVALVGLHFIYMIVLAEKALFWGIH